MKLLKLIVFLFVLHFLRRFFQLYRAMKNHEANKLRETPSEPKAAADDAIPADYKII